MTNPPFVDEQLSVVLVLLSICPNPECDNLKLLEGSYYCTSCHWNYTPKLTAAKWWPND